LDSEPGLTTASNDHGYTILHFASLTGDKEIIGLLLAKGADIQSCTSDGRTPLFFTIPFSRGEAMQYLLEKGADIAAVDNNGRSALHHALDWGRPHIINILLKAGIPIKEDKNRATAMLEQAALLGHRQLAARLLEEGAELYTESRNGRTLLHCASSGGLIDLARRLIKQGAEKEAKDIHTLTPLHLAASNGHSDMIRLLLEHEASVNTKSADGRTPYHLAQSAGHTEAQDVLRSEGAKVGPAVFPALKDEMLGQARPGKTAEMFSPGIISTEKLESSITFSPDGKTCVFSRSLPGDPLGSILYVTYCIDSIWSPPKPLLPESWRSELSAAFSPSGDRLIFISRHSISEKEANKRDFDIWEIEKTAKGWGEPHHLGPPVNTDVHELYTTQSRSGNLYFHRSGINRAVRKGEAYLPPENISERFEHVSGCGHPFISADESYLIFDARAAGKNQTDLYITFRRPDVSWTPPASLGPEINSPKINELCAWVTPDERQLFFQRNADIYWVDADIIYKLKSRVLNRYHDKRPVGDS